METVLVIGAARSGIAVSKLLQKNGYHVILTDSNEVKEKMDLEFIKFTLKWNKKKRKDILKYLNNVDKNKVLIFKRRKDLNNWYKREFNISIERILNR